MKQTSLIRFRIDFSECSNLGPGKIALLEGIRIYRSVSETARQMGLSYRRAWLLLDSLNKTFELPATEHSVGGRGGGGAEVTDFGILLIERYREVERKLKEVAGEELKEIRSRVLNRSAAKSASNKVTVTKRRRRGWGALPSAG
jgi:molybdate transport system regulatory protein